MKQRTKSAEHRSAILRSFEQCVERGSWANERGLVARRGRHDHAHPPGNREEGWEQVRASWERLSEIISGGRITVSDLLVRVGGDLIYTVCIEHPEAPLGYRTVRFDDRATNVYRREDGEWKMVHHHIDVSPAMQEALGGLG